MKPLAPSRDRTRVSKSDELRAASASSSIPPSSTDPTAASKVAITSSKDRALMCSWCWAVNSSIMTTSYLSVDRSMAGEVVSPDNENGAGLGAVLYEEKEHLRGGVATVSQTRAHEPPRASGHSSRSQTPFRTL